MPVGFWNSKKNQRKYVDWLGEEIKCGKFLAFYELQQADFQKNSGWGFLNTAYSGSVPNAISNVYPEFLFQYWQFAKCTVCYHLHICSPVRSIKNEIGRLLGLAAKPRTVPIPSRVHPKLQDARRLVFVFTSMRTKE